MSKKIDFYFGDTLYYCETIYDADFIEPDEPLHERICIGKLVVERMAFTADKKDVIINDTASIDHCYKTLAEAKQRALDILNAAAEHIRNIKEEDL